MKQTPLLNLFGVTFRQIMLMWQSLLKYFNTLEERPIERLAFIVGSLLILWIIEGAIPLLPLKYKK
jgi:hypothetical protein